MLYLEYYDKGSLLQLWDEGFQFDEVDASRLLRQGLDALDWLHTRKPQILHRDIKPDNILIKSYDPLEIRLTDFGLSKQSENFDTRVWTPRYTAPELLDSRKNGYTDIVDVWSLGVVMLECRDVDRFQSWFDQFISRSKGQQFDEEYDDEKYESEPNLQFAATWPESLVKTECERLDRSVVPADKRRLIEFVLRHMVVLDHQQRSTAYNCLRALRRPDAPPPNATAQDGSPASDPSILPSTNLSSAHRDQFSSMTMTVSSVSEPYQVHYIISELTFEVG